MKPSPQVGNDLIDLRAAPQGVAAVALLASDRALAALAQ